MGYRRGWNSSLKVLLVLGRHSERELDTAFVDFALKLVVGVDGLLVFFLFFFILLDDDIQHMLRLFLDLGRNLDADISW